MAHFDKLYCELDFHWLAGSSLASGGHAMGNDPNVLELSKYFVLFIDGGYARIICLIFLKLTAITRYIMKYINKNFLRVWSSIYEVGILNEVLQFCHKELLWVRKYSIQLK